MTDLQVSSPFTQLLSVVIGLAFAYLLLSLICAAANELIAWFFDLRANTLRKGIATMLGEHDVRTRWERLWAWITLRTPTGPVVDKLYDHGLIQGLAQGGPLPAYIPSRAFALALLDQLKEKSIEKLKAAGETPSDEQGPIGDAKEVKQLREAIDLMPNPQLQQVLRSLLDRTVDDMDTARTRIAAWYDDTMDRVSGWYKRRSQVQVLLCAVLVTLAVNADTITLSKRLWSDRAFASAINQAARQYVDAHKDALKPPQSANPNPTDNNSANPNPATQPNPQTPTKAVADIEQSYVTLVEAGMPFGWHEHVPDRVHQRTEFLHFLWLKALGLLLTILALLQGAPFWFDVLSKVVRSAGPKPEKDADLQSNDA